MNKLHKISEPGFSSGGGARLVMSLLLSAVLAGSLWFATLPAAFARNVTPSEMIEQCLPPGKTVQTASKAEFLAGVYAAVKKHHAQAVEITKAAVEAHHNYAGDSVATILRGVSRLDCNFVEAIVLAALQAAPGEASAIDDAALAMAPDCSDAIQTANSGLPGGGPDGGARGGLGSRGGGDFGGGTAGVGVGATSFGGGGGGGGFNPQDQLLLVCDNGAQRTVRETLLGAFLRSHVGSFVGSCQPTPTTNR